MADESIIITVRNYLRALRDQGFPVRFGILFGSFATGKADVWSDIDLLVVSPRFDSPRDRNDIDRLWITAGQVDSRVEPIPCGEKQWVEDDSSAIIEIARREGEKIVLS